MVLLSDCRFVQSGPLEYECSQKTHIDPVCPIVERSGSHVTIAWHPQRGCALYELTPNKEQEGQSDFR
jgi:hypothetical protein